MKITEVHSLFQKKAFKILKRNQLMKSILRSKSFKINTYEVNETANKVIAPASFKFNNSQHFLS